MNLLQDGNHIYLQFDRYSIEEINDYHKQFEYAFAAKISDDTNNINIYLARVTGSILKSLQFSDINISCKFDQNLSELSLFVSFEGKYYQLQFNGSEMSVLVHFSEIGSDSQQLPRHRKNIPLEFSITYTSDHKVRALAYENEKRGKNLYGKVSEKVDYFTIGDNTINFVASIRNNYYNCIQYGLHNSYRSVLTFLILFRCKSNLLTYDVVKYIAKIVWSERSNYYKDRRNMVNYNPPVLVDHLPNVTNWLNCTDVVPRLNIK